MKIRGFGGVYRPTYKDKRTGKLKKSSIWWIQYYAHGKKKLENSHSRNRSDALKLLKKRVVSKNTNALKILVSRGVSDRRD